MKPSPTFLRLTAPANSMKPGSVWDEVGSGRILVCGVMQSNFNSILLANTSLPGYEFLAKRPTVAAWFGSLSFTRSPLSGYLGEKPSALSGRLYDAYNQDTINVPAFFFFFFFCCIAFFFVVEVRGNRG